MAAMASRIISRLQEVAQDVVAHLREDRLRVELHTLDGVAAVAHGHDDAAVGLGGDLQLVLREALALDGQRVVADRLERIGQATEHALALVVYHRRLAVEDLAGARHGAAERLADRLEPQADAQDRHLPTGRQGFPGEMPDEGHADASLLWGGRPRGGGEKTTHRARRPLPPPPLP